MAAEPLGLEGVGGGGGPLDIRGTHWLGVPGHLLSSHMVAADVAGHERPVRTSFCRITTFTIRRIIRLIPVTYVANSTVARSPVLPDPGTPPRDQWRICRCRIRAAEKVPCLPSSRRHRVGRTRPLVGGLMVNLAPPRTSFFSRPPPPALAPLPAPLALTRRKDESSHPSLEKPPAGSRKPCPFGVSAVRGKLRQRTVSLYRSMSYGLFCPGTI